MILRYNLATGTASPSITVHTVGIPQDAEGSGPNTIIPQDRTLFATADDSTFITPLATQAGGESEIDNANGSDVTTSYQFQSMSSDLTTLDALDPSSDPNSGYSEFDTFRAPFTSVFQRGTETAFGNSSGLLNRDGNLAMGWDGQSDFSSAVSFTTIPGNDKVHQVQWSYQGNMCWGGPDAVDGSHALYYFILIYGGVCSSGNAQPDEVGIVNLNNFTYSGYINLPSGYRRVLDVSEINGDLYVPVGPNIDVWNVPSCECARVQRILPGYFSDAIPIADRSGQYLILYGHPASNPNEVDVIGVNALTGALEHTYFKGIAPTGYHLSVTSVLAQ